jgi:hypothetical protein
MLLLWPPDEKTRAQEDNLMYRFLTIELGFEPTSAILPNELLFLLL